MATWHQQQARRRAYKAGKPIVFWHATLWTVLCDPYGAQAWSMRFPTKAEAETYLGNLQRAGKAQGCYILAPQ